MKQGLCEQIILCESVPQMLRECNTMPGIWPLELRNISRSRGVGVNQITPPCNAGRGRPWCPAKVVPSTWRQELPTADTHYTVDPGAHTQVQHSHARRGGSADGQNKGTGTTSHVSAFHAGLIIRAVLKDRGGKKIIWQSCQQTNQSHSMFVFLAQYPVRSV